MQTDRKLAPFENLISEGLPVAIISFGWIYFIFSIIWCIYILVKYKLNTLLIYDVASKILSGLIVLLISWGIYRIIKQNILLITRSFERD